MKNSEKWMCGLPYVGNKGQKAQQIIDLLPSGGRFIDVFGGGGSISLHACNSGKWDEVIYNDRRKTVVNLLKALIEDSPHFDLIKYVYMDRETFYNWRDNMPDSIERTLVLIAWSFGNNMRDYLWGKKVEKEKLQRTRALFFGNTGTKLDDLYSYSKNETSISGKYKMFHKWRREEMNISGHYDILQQLGQLQQLERLKQLEPTERLQQLEYSTLDYHDLIIRPDDIVYCDPPYVNTGVNYGGWNPDAFYAWLAACPAKQIYISEYTKLPHTEVAFNLGKKHSLTAVGTRREELLLEYVG
ncbi:DNA adenine methylase [Levilactobacillus mulengensis]|uniref:DNA adenine methylase n=1 Tax=Levilactobacillus mulengensis TaxID=2486025 RepID=UPI000F77C796|nr:DNA adenine methylase [Levilactobacillus mulengensis]